MRACNGNRGFIAVRNYHTDLLWNYKNFKRVAAVPRCSCGLETLPRCCPGAEHSAPCSPRARLSSPRGWLAAEGLRCQTSSQRGHHWQAGGGAAPDPLRPRGTVPHQAGHFWCAFGRQRAVANGPAEDLPAGVHPSQAKPV